jgi:hypothetical protein
MNNRIKMYSGILIVFIFIFIFLSITYMKKNQLSAYQILDYVYQDLFISNVDSNLLLGTSSIKRLEDTKDFSCANWINRGIYNANLHDIINYIKITPLTINPKKIIIYAGENYIVQGHSVQKTVDLYQSLLKLLLKKYKDTQFHIYAIKSAPAREKYRSNFNELNHKLKSLYINEANVFIHQRKFISNNTTSIFSDDAVHYSSFGNHYVFSEVLTECLQK